MVQEPQRQVSHDIAHMYLYINLLFSILLLAAVLPNLILFLLQLQILPLLVEGVGQVGHHHLAQGQVEQEDRWVLGVQVGLKELHLEVVGQLELV